MYCHFNNDTNSTDGTRNRLFPMLNSLFKHIPAMKRIVMTFSLVLKWFRERRVLVHLRLQQMEIQIIFYHVKLF